jgi:hypothetical protein
MRCRLFLIAVLGLRAYPQPATLAGFSDSGVFALYANEDRLGTFAFEWKPNGSFEAKVVVAIDKQENVSTVSLTPDAEGRWVKALLRGSKDTTTWESDGKTLQFTSPDITGKGQWPLDSLTFEIYTPPLMTQALRRYDAAAGGAQDFPVILLNLSTIDDQTLTVERLETRDYNIGTRRIIHRSLFPQRRLEIACCARPDALQEGADRGARPVLCAPRLRVRRSGCTRPIRISRRMGALRPRSQRRLRQH